MTTSWLPILGSWVKAEYDDSVGVFGFVSFARIVLKRYLNNSSSKPSWQSSRNHKINWFLAELS